MKDKEQIRTAPDPDFEIDEVAKGDKIPVKIKRVHQKAVIPSYAKAGDAGFDFYAIEDVMINDGETALVRTGLKVAIPESYEIQIRPRSGLSLKSGLRIANSPGTIDSGYRGEVCIICEYHGEPGDFYIIRPGDKIAQGVIKKVPQALFKEVDVLPDSERGSGGFGSTGN